jgi:hypothetical protein
MGFGRRAVRARSAKRSGRRRAQVIANGKYLKTAILL